MAAECHMHDLASCRALCNISKATILLLPAPGQQNTMKITTTMYDMRWRSLGRHAQRAHSLRTRRNKPSRSTLIKYLSGQSSSKAGLQVRHKESSIPDLAISCVQSRKASSSGNAQTGVPTDCPTNVHLQAGVQLS